ncbi:transmembrane protein 163a-like isoform X1 [Argopecten irradians]|uniref:transmembrane protein 163a-like isoform X1 n=1 Tax=Argopecten irradians TaxID=31199 RepID=UPI003721C263
MSDNEEKYKTIANGTSDIKKVGSLDNHTGNGKHEMSLFSHEKAELLERKRRVSFRSAVRLRYAAIVVSWLSVICAFVQGTLALVLSITRNSSTLFGFGLAALLDSASSIVVLWRFHSKEIYSESAESRACLIIGFFFLLSSLFLVGKTIYDLVRRVKEIKSSMVWTLALVNGVINVILGVSKICIGYKIESMALLTDSKYDNSNFLKSSGHVVCWNCINHVFVFFFFFFFLHSHLPKSMNINLKTDSFLVTGTVYFLCIHHINTRQICHGIFKYEIHDLHLLV